MGLAVTLHDAAALAESWGAGTQVALGAGSGPAEIFAPAGLALGAGEIAAVVKSGAGSYVLSFGNGERAPEAASLAPVLDALIEASGIGFMAACFANPGFGRTVYQGHLFQDGALLGNLRHMLAPALSGRVAVLTHQMIAAGPQAIRKQIARCREQGAALALLDAVDLAQCNAIAAALEGQLLTGGPAWVSPATKLQPEPAAPTGRLAILSGGLDRQTLFQLGAARAALPFFQLDFNAADPAAAALAWANAQAAARIVISASAPPDRLHPGAPAAHILAVVAEGLADQGYRRFLITGNDTSSTILSHLGIGRFTAGASEAGLRWLGAQNYSFLLKPSGFGAKNLFLGEFGPQIRLNAAAE